MSTFTIESKELGRTITFTYFADDDERKTSYLWADTNGKEGTLGDQCMNRGYIGSALIVTEENVRRVARQWLRKISE